MSLKFDPTMNWNVLIYLAGLAIAMTAAYGQFRVTINSLTTTVAQNAAELIAQKAALTAQDARMRSLETSSASDRSTLSALQRDVARLLEGQAETNRLLRDAILSGGGR
jgi:hypothetical protein